MCSICQSNFAHQDFVCRLGCRHMFHTTCHEHMTRVANQDTEYGVPPAILCPNCRGRGEIVAARRYIAPEHAPEAANLPERYGRARSRTQAPFTRPRSAPPNDSAGFLNCSSNYPIQTNLADGRPSIIVDPGSVGNLCGDKWARDVAMLAKRNGQKPYQKRPRPLDVCGVRNGHSRATTIVHYQLLSTHRTAANPTSATSVYQQWPTRIFQVFLA